MLFDENARLSCRHQLIGKFGLGLGLSPKSRLLVLFKQAFNHVAITAAF